MIQNNFNERHIGPKANERQQMLDVVGAKSLEDLISQTIPSAIRLPQDLDLPEGISEVHYMKHIRNIASKNKIFTSYIGLGYYDTIVPAPIQRNMLENPGWYTSYTPYQAEISQGRLEALLNYQTMVSELTGLELANASLLDEGTAAAEAMHLCIAGMSRTKKKAKANRFLVDENLMPQSIEVLKTRALPLGIELVIEDPQKMEFCEMCVGAIVQYPDQFGEIKDYKNFVERAHEQEVMVVAAADLMSLVMITPPGEWGADIAIGTTQRFGIPMGYGGPHAAYFATSEKYKRQLPGRIIGVSKDAAGNRALRMALQTREQHIKRDRATSNICTAQALLANMAGMYGVYHGPKGLKNIATDIHAMAVAVEKTLVGLGYVQLNKNYFDTLLVELPEAVKVEDLKAKAEEAEMNLRYIDNNKVGISLDETKTLVDINKLVAVFAAAKGEDAVELAEYDIINEIDAAFQRTSDFMHQEVFNTHHSETELMRYMAKLENKDLALNRAMIPLGSCTMKLNAVTEMAPITWPEFGGLHPFIPANQAEGYKELIDNLECQLKKITGFDAVSFQPNSGASGEYAGLMVIRAYHEDRGEGHRNICLIPSSAHGTNPASAVMAGMKVVVTKATAEGEIDVEDFRANAEKYKDDLAAAMITYPSTHGVFEEAILELMKIMHDNGGQVYMDGANMNAQVGFTNPGFIGADVCHLNLHKTFAIPHGGGGPGVGPIGVAAHLTKFLPNHINKEDLGTEKSLGSVSAAPYGSASILPISYAYNTMLGNEGLKESTAMAILNANYIMKKLDGHYKTLYTGMNNRVAHELILDCNEFMKSAGVTVGEIAKRLMDYGLHAPTVAFPVHGTLMVEPTESEPLYEIDRFIEAMIAIREEIREIEEGKADKDNNVVKNAPHTMAMVTVEEWDRPYTREKAAFPTAHVKDDKYWPTVTKIDDGYGDRNLMCTCDPIETYE
jgi:glycine dehydrogenase